MESQLTLEQAQKFVKTKKHLYKAMLRNDWYLPNMKSSIITQDYMKRIRQKEIYCPRFQDLKPKPCPDPPAKDIILKKINEVAQQKQLNLGITAEKVPDKAWLIQILAVLKEDDEIFQKDYYPEQIKSQKEIKIVDNGDDFFTGLPTLTRKIDLKRKSRLQEYLGYKEEGDIKKLKEYKASIERKIQTKDEILKKRQKKQKIIKISEQELKAMQQKLKQLEQKGTANRSGKDKTPSKNSQN